MLTASMSLGVSTKGSVAILGLHLESAGSSSGALRQPCEVWNLCPRGNTYNTQCNDDRRLPSHLFFFSRDGPKSLPVTGALRFAGAPRAQPPFFGVPGFFSGASVFWGPRFLGPALGRWPSRRKAPSLFPRSGLAGSRARGLGSVPRARNSGYAALQASMNPDYRNQQLGRRSASREGCGRGEGSPWGRRKGSPGRSARRPQRMELDLGMTQEDFRSTVSCCHCRFGFTTTGWRRGRVGRAPCRSAERCARWEGFHLGAQIVCLLFFDSLQTSLSTVTRTKTHTLTHTHTHLGDEPVLFALAYPHQGDRCWKWCDRTSCMVPLEPCTASQCWHRRTHTHTHTCTHPHIDTAAHPHGHTATRPHLRPPTRTPTPAHAHAAARALTRIRTRTRTHTCAGQRSARAHPADLHAHAHSLTRTPRANAYIGALVRAHAHAHVRTEMQTQTPTRTQTHTHTCIEMHAPTHRPTTTATATPTPTATATPTHRNTRAHADGHSPTHVHALFHTHAQAHAYSHATKKKAGTLHNAQTQFFAMPKRTWRLWDLQTCLLAREPDHPRP